MKRHAGVQCLLSLVLIVGCHLVACSTGDGGDGETPFVAEPDGTIISVQAFDNAVQAAADGEQGQNASRTPAEEANIGYVPSSATGGRDLNTWAVGTESWIQYDIDNDSALEDIWVFVVQYEDITFLAWEDDSLCHLAWSEAGTAWYIFGVCGGEGEEGAVVCSTNSETSDSSCNQCSDETCDDPCTVDGADVTCEPEEPQPEPDPITDAGLDVAAETGVEVTEEPADEPTTTNLEPGDCIPSCMEQSMAVCCWACGCQGEIRCDPQCASPYEWDCEWQCCFNYDTFECNCPTNAPFNESLGCCADDSGCIYDPREY